MYKYGNRKYHVQPRVAQRNYEEREWETPEPFINAEKSVSENKNLTNEYDYQQTDGESSGVQIDGDTMQNTATEKNELTKKALRTVNLMRKHDCAVRKITGGK